MYIIFKEKHVFFLFFSKFNKAFIGINWVLCKTEQNAICNGYLMYFNVENREGYVLCIMHISSIVQHALLIFLRCIPW